MGKEHSQETIELKARMPGCEERSVRERRWLHGRSRSGPDVFCRNTAKSASGRRRRGVVLLLRTDGQRRKTCSAAADQSERRFGNEKSRLRSARNSGVRRKRANAAAE